MNRSALVAVFVLSVAGVLALSACSPPKSASSGGEASSSTAAPAKPVPAGTVAVPDLAGKAQAAATDALGTAGLLPLVTFVATDSAKAGNVVAQAPEGGVALAPGSQVAVVVAKTIPVGGPIPIPVPGVFQMKRADAQSALMSVGFDPVFAEFGGQEGSGTSFAQAPSSLEQAVPGTVLVLMSNGKPALPASVVIPTVTGLTQSAAEKSLATAKLTAQPVMGFNSAAKGTVFAQFPSAGGKIGPQTAIVIAVSLGPLPPASTMLTVPDVTTLDPGKAVEVLHAAGLQAQLAEIKSPQFAAGAVVGQLPPAGWSVPGGTTAIVSVNRGK